MKRDWRTILAVAAVLLAAAALLVALVFRVDSTGVDAGKANRKADKNTVSIKDLKAVIRDQEATDRRVAAVQRQLARKANRNENRGVRTQRSLTTLNRFVLGDPGARGLAGRSIEGPRGVTGLTTTGPQGNPGESTNGTNGSNGTDGTNGKDAPPAINGTDGEDGADSTVPGPQGPGPTDEQVQAAVDAYCAAHNNCAPPLVP